MSQVKELSEDGGFGLFILALLAANVIPMVIIYKVLWITGAAQKDMELHCNDRGEVVARALLLTWGVWLVVGLAFFASKSKDLNSAVIRGLLLTIAIGWVYHRFF